MGKLRISAWEEFSSRFISAIAISLSLIVGGGCGGGTVGSNPPVKVLVGTVQNENAQPVQNAEVDVTGGGTTFQTVTDTEGDFVLQLDFPSGTSEAQIQVVAQGARSTIVSVPVASPGGTSLSVVLELNNRHELRVVSTQFGNEESPSSGKGGSDPILSPPQDDGSSSNSSGDSSSSSGTPNPKGTPNPTPTSAPTPEPTPDIPPVESYQTMAVTSGAKDIDTQQAVALPGRFTISFTSSSGGGTKVNGLDGNFQDVAFPTVEQGQRYVTLHVHFWTLDGSTLLLSKDFQIQTRPTWVNWVNDRPDTIKIGLVLVVQNGIPIDINIRPLGEANRGSTRPPPDDKGSGDGKDTGVSTPTEDPGDKASPEDPTEKETPTPDNGKSTGEPSKSDPSSEIPLK